MIECSDKGDLVRVQKAIESGADVNWILESDPDWHPQSRQDNPFSYPSYSVDSGYARETCALHVAVMGAHRDIIHYLLKQKTYIPFETIESAIENQPFEIISMLAKIKFQTYGDTSDKSALLAAACHYGRKDVAEFLIGFGADVNGASYYRALKPVKEAALNNYSSILKLLFREGADPQVVSRFELDKLSPTVQRLLERQKRKLDASKVLKAA